ncbi:chorismate transformation enzyme, FkbO/Hyg5 family [Caballeronia glebae]|uniref:chorismate transformation enzyme, FkbO/Hyg5 family n=1 Tax=Caballeronia glebae TaxID=1777143 RepID=UPI002E102D45
MYDDARDGFAEIWTCAGPIRSGRFNDLVFAHDDEFLFCAGFIPSSGQYTEATRKAYGDAFALVGELNFPKIFRMWNFIPHINGANREGLEVYRDFCRGRAIAFERDYADASGMPGRRASAHGARASASIFWRVARIRPGISRTRFRRPRMRIRSATVRSRRVSRAAPCCAMRCSSRARPAFSDTRPCTKAISTSNGASRSAISRI